MALKAALFGLIFMVPGMMHADCSFSSFFGGDEECWGRAPEECKSNPLNCIDDVLAKAGEATGVSSAIAWTEEQWNKAAEWLADQVLAPLKEELAKIGRKILAIAAQINQGATMLENISAELKEQTKDFDAMGDQLKKGAEDLTLSMTDIQKGIVEIGKQRKEIQDQNLKGKGLVELAQLETTLLQALDETESALKTLAADPACSSGILCEFRTSITQLENAARVARMQKNDEIKELDQVINKPALSYPSFPKRLRAVSSLFEGVGNLFEGNV